MKLGSLVLVLAFACGGSKPTSAPAPTPAPGSAATTPVAKPALRPDQCCCPFASAEGVAFNVSPKADCEAAGSECVEETSCK